MKHLIENFVETIWNDGELTRVPEFISPTYTVDGNPFGIEGVTRNVALYRTAFPDLKLTLKHFFASEDSAATLVRITGTHTNEWKGTPARGGLLDIVEAGFWQVEDGLIVSGEFVVDRALIREQLGAGI